MAARGRDQGAAYHGSAGYRDQLGRGECGAQGDPGWSDNVSRSGALGGGTAYMDRNGCMFSFNVYDEVEYTDKIPFSQLLNEEKCCVATSKGPNR